MKLADTGSRLRAGTIDDPYGGTGTERDWTTATSTAMASLTQPRTGTEESGDRAQAIGDWQAFLYPDADITAADRWVYRSQTYQIHSVLLWPDLRGRDHHIELDLSIITESS